MRAGRYAKLVPTVTQIPPCMMESKKKRVSERGAAAESFFNDTAEKQELKLDVNAILKHFWEHGEAKTFVSSPCKIPISTGDMAVAVYVLPK